eukprot:2894080-Pyramimonas_sp.AAC.1
MMLTPWRTFKQQRGLGLGFEGEQPSTGGFNFLVSVGFSKIRMHNVTPLYWHRSDGAGLRKSDQPGPRGRRA